MGRKDAGENLVVIAQPFELMIGEQSPVSSFLRVYSTSIRLRERRVAADPSLEARVAIPH